MFSFSFWIKVTISFAQPKYLARQDGDVTFFTIRVVFATLLTLLDEILLAVFTKLLG